MKEIPQPGYEEEPADGIEIIRKTVQATIKVYEDLGIIFSPDEITNLPLEELQGRVDGFRQGLIDKGENPDKYFAKLIMEKIEENDR